MMMMMMSNLPHDLVEEILTRAPLKSLRAVRSTCKKWNALTKDRSFTDKHIGKVTASGEKEFLMLVGYRVYLIGVNVHGIQNNNVDVSIKRKAKLIALDDSEFHRSQVFRVFHSNGLLLCVLDTRLVVWNPYWGKPKSIKRRHSMCTSSEIFSLGYDKSCGSQKVLSLFQNKVEIYDLSSNSWMLTDCTVEWELYYIKCSLSLKGNTYWYAKDFKLEEYIICFDFTKERFGPCPPLPMSFINKRYSPSIHAIREEMLAVLLQPWNTYELEIWVTNKIEPDALPWSKFLKINKRPISVMCGGFLIDEEKKLALFF
ncbi:F-box protein [Cardamine amara subsp. amara]|uniref:F-box protein n=1 Tax=Cardamine amara subsp. amara TaxID=228776 RepID=A0ABD0ZRW1_CARAN